MNPSQSSFRGAYGFRLDYPDPGEHLDDLIDVDESAPKVDVAWRHATTTENIEEVHDQAVVYGTRMGVTFRVRRDPPSILFDLPSPPPPGALVHPLLTVGIAIHARWRGDVTLHAGAFETEEGAWGVMGLREAGKSALLATLAAKGHRIVADDLLALQGGRAWAGPSCVDLRPDTAERFPCARYLGVVGGRHRFRLSTLPGRSRVPFRGFFVLGWQDSYPSIEIEPMEAKERLEWLYRQEYISLMGWPDPTNLLPLMGLPAWRVTRPPAWEGTDEVVERMLAVTAQPGRNVRLV